ncbi:golgin subfamily A member 6-like protein 7 [Camellia sinensis]|uniref:golgin subfamily A member 6-like protein 7 n=1 Tax=Camellia sinensis TaxID=4442 RepID=UPI0010362BC8|nr:golgin subfamily A member 6-like protein 7 [Camellia sinensis]
MEEGAHRVYRGPPPVSHSPGRHGAEEGDVARSAQYSKERHEAKGDQPEDTNEEKDQQQEQEEQQTNQQQQVNEQEMTNQQEELQKKSDIFHTQGHDQPQTPTKKDNKDKLISAMRAQIQDMEQKFMAELRKKEDQLKEMSTKKTGSPQQRSMVKRIKQKSRKQAHDPNFEYQPMTKAKEDTRNKTQTAADVPKPTEGTDEEKEKKNKKKKEEIETETKPATELEQKEGVHEAK